MTTGPLLGIAGGTLLLLCVGIHNAWDTVAYLIESRLKASDRRTRPRRRAMMPEVPGVVIRPAMAAVLPALGRRRGA